MNNILEIRELTDSNQWESFLSAHSSDNYPFFQSWNWGEVQKRLGFQLVRIGIFDTNKLTGVALLIDVNAKRGHYLHLRHGPVLEDFEKYFDVLLEEVKKIARKRQVSFIRISPLLKKQEFQEIFFQKRGFRYAPIHNMDAEICSILSLDKTEDVLLKQMRKSHRYLIKKAGTLPIDILQSTNSEDIKLFLALYSDFSSQKGFVAHRGIIEEFDVLRNDNQIILFLAKYEGKIIAGVLIDYVGKVAIYHHAASNTAYKQIPANYLLLWEAIKEAKKRGKSYFNLWGIAPSEKKNHPWTGFTLFKTGFGGEKVEFLHAMDLALKPLYWKTYMIDLITKKRKGY